MMICSRGMTVRHDGTRWLCYIPKQVDSKMKIKKDYGIFKEQFEDLYNLAIQRFNPGKAYLPKKRIPCAANYIYELLCERYPDMEKAGLIDYKEILQNTERIYHNSMMRYQTCNRKVKNLPWNWFVTLTYSDEKFVSSEAFLKKVKTCLNHLSDRRGWRYFGKIEKGDENSRIHLHLVCYIPPDQMVGDLKKVSNRSRKKHAWRVTILNTFFDEVFGWNEFSPVDQMRLRAGGFKYLTQYMSKNGERFIYGRHTPKQYEDIPLTEDDFEQYEDGNLVLVERYNTFFVVKDDSFLADPMTLSLFEEESIEYYDP